MLKSRRFYQIALGVILLLEIYLLLAWSNAELFFVDGIAFHQGAFNLFTQLNYTSA